MSKAIDEARAAVAELEAKHAALVARTAEREAAKAPAKKRLDAYVARQRKQPVVINAANSITFTSRAAVSVQSWHLGHLGEHGTPKKADVIAGLVNGAIKVSGIGGITYTGRGMSQRVRVPLPADVKAFEKARRLRIRADERARKAAVAERAAAAAAFEHGTRISLDELAADWATAALLRLAHDKLPAADSWEADRMVNSEYGELSIARKHLAHMAKREEDTGCTVCQQAARVAKEKAELEARVRALPRKRFTCPAHGHKLAFSERRREFVRFGDGTQDGRWIAECPVLWCPVDLARFIDRPQLLADEAKAAKPKPKPKPKTRTVTFMCPNPECGVTATSEVVNEAVTCDTCDVEYDVDHVRIVRKAAA